MEISGRSIREKQSSLTVFPWFLVSPVFWKNLHRPPPNFNGFEIPGGPFEIWKKSKENWTISLEEFPGKPLNSIIKRGWRRWKNGITCPMNTCTIYQLSSKNPTLMVIGQNLVFQIVWGFIHENIYMSLKNLFVI